jgi:hypothetical protein
MKTTHHTLIEPLEPRIAPAVIIGMGGKTATFTDVDGDLVTVKVSKGTLDDSNFILIASGVGEQLRTFTLQQDDEFRGANISILATSVGGSGDGFVNVGEFDAEFVDLGKVVIGGDVGRFDIGDDGDAANRPAVKSLTVQSLRAFGDGTGASDHRSILSSPAGNVTVKGDVVGASITDQFGAALKDFGSLTIGGSLIGTGDIEGGAVLISEASGPIVIKGGIIGGDGKRSGYLYVGEAPSVTIHGDIVGGAGELSGSLHSSSVKTINVRGSLIGGGGLTSGILDGGENSRVTVRGDIVGGAGNNSGKVSGNSIKSLVVGGSIRGGSGDSSGLLDLLSAGTVAVSGSIIGGGGVGAGRAEIDVLGKGLTLGGSVIGGSVAQTGKIEVGSSLSNKAQGYIRILGDVVGGAGNVSGRITSQSLADIGPVSIGGSILGGTGDNSGGVDLRDGGSNSIPFFKTGGSIVGGSGLSGGRVTLDGEFTAVQIGGSVIGGSASGTGALQVSGTNETIQIGGSVLGGSGNFSGGISGSTQHVAKLVIGGSIVGGSLGFGASEALTQTGFIQLPTITSLKIGGSIIAGTDSSQAFDLSYSGGISTQRMPQSVTIGGGILGNATNTAALLLGSGENSLTLTIGGGVKNADILGGHQLFNGAVAPVAGKSQFASVRIGGDWHASNLVAGVDDGADNQFGTMDDILNAGTTVSRIAKVIIKGQAAGTFAGSDSFGIVAQEIGSLKIGALFKTPTAAQPVVILGPTGDFTARTDV